MKKKRMILFIWIFVLVLSFSFIVSAGWCEDNFHVGTCSAEELGHLDCNPSIDDQIIECTNYTSIGGEYCWSFLQSCIFTSHPSEVCLSLNNGSADCVSDLDDDNFLNYGSSFSYLVVKAVIASSSSASKPCFS